MVPVAGRRTFPLAVTASAGGDLWVTLRDASTLVRLDADGTERRRWRLPSWPHTAAVAPDGRIWTALTRRGRVAVVEPVRGDVEVHRLRRSREVLGVAVAPSATYVVDAANRLLWEVAGGRPSSIPLPGAIRPDIPLVDDDGAVWVTDTQRPSLLRVEPATGAVTEHPVGDGTRLLARCGTRIWCSCTRRPRLVAVDGSGAVADEVDLPGVPFGVAARDDGVVAAAVPDLDLLAVVSAAETRTIPLPPGARPHDVAWHGQRLVATCPGSGTLALVDV